MRFTRKYQSQENKGRKIAVKSFIFFVSLLLLQPFPISGQAGKRLAMRYHRQHTQVWCWAASIAMVVEYLKGGRIEDCEVLSLYDRRFGGPGRCCEGDPRCQRGSMPGEIGPILGNIFDVHGRILDRGLTWSEIVSNIDDDKPIIAWVWNSPTSAHVVVIVGYRQPRVILIFDPLTGPKEVSFDGFAANWGPGHNWNISWIFSSGRSGRTSETPIPRPGPARRQVECQHRIACGHRVACGHRQECVHRIQCQHPIWTPYGLRPAHPYDTVHPYDVMHPYDTLHPYDTEHPFDYVN